MISFSIFRRKLWTLTAAVSLSILLISVLTCGSEAKFLPGRDGWSHELDLEEENGIVIMWKNLPPEEVGDGERWIVMKVTARTQGYVGVGFSPNGAMAGADMAIGWVDSSGAPHLKDFHATANAEPILDKAQDYELIMASEDVNGTTIEFRRKWYTCDDKDIDITNDTMRLIWAYSPFDPIIEKDSVRRLQWHGTKTRGAVSAYVVDDMFAAPFPREDDPSIKYWDMRMENNVINAEYTTYFCKIIKFPHLEKKHQMIGYRPIIPPENRKKVHHITFYECMVPPELGKTEDVFEKHLNHSGGRCFTPMLPSEWGTYCVTFLFVWVSGSEGEMLPEHVGLPLGEEHGGATYFMLEMHYDNPDLETFRDSSGVRIYYTDDLRPNDGSTVLMGYRITPFLLLPPAQSNFVTYGICSAECTEKAIPPEGISVFITLLHAHLSGRKLRLRHFRGGKELPLIAEDNHYDFNYQQSRKLQKEVKLMPGDEFLVECEYDTVDNNRITLGGLATTQEMCQAFLLYYPRIDLMQCTSQAEYYDFFNAFGIKNVSGTGVKAMGMPYNPHLLPPEEQTLEPLDNAKELEETGDGASFKSVYDLLTIDKPEKLRGKTVGDFMKEVEWRSEEGRAFAKAIEKRLRNSRHYAYCTGHGRRRIPLQKHIISIPEAEEPLRRQNSSTCSSSSRKSWSGTVIRYSEPDSRDGFNKPEDDIHNTLSISGGDKLMVTIQTMAIISLLPYLRLL